MHTCRSNHSRMEITKRYLTIALRLIAVAATFIGAIIMATSHEETNLLFLKFDVNYDDTPAFKYFVIANGIVSGYSLLVIFLPSQSLLWKLVFALDVIIAMVLTSAISAALSVAIIGKKGNYQAGWQPICGQVPHFCRQVTGALVAGFIGVVAYLFVLLCSIHTILDPLLLSK